MMGSNAAPAGAVIAKFVLYLDGYLGGYGTSWFDDLSFTLSQVRVSWDPNTEEDLDGYRVYYGVSSGNYDNCEAVGKDKTDITLNLTSGVRYYFAVTAVDNSGNESSSYEISYDVPYNVP
jgi:hypothetical protein